MTIKIWATNERLLNLSFPIVECMKIVWLTWKMNTFRREFIMMRIQIPQGIWHLFHRSFPNCVYWIRRPAIFFSNKFISFFLTFWLLRSSKSSKVASVYTMVNMCVLETLKILQLTVHKNVSGFAFWTFLSLQLVINTSKHQSFCSWLSSQIIANIIYILLTQLYRSIHGTHANNWWNFWFLK